MSNRNKAFLSFAEWFLKDDPRQQPTADGILNDQCSALRLEELLEEIMEVGIEEKNDVTEKAQEEKTVKWKTVEEKTAPKEEKLLRRRKMLGTSCRFQEKRSQGGGREKGGREWEWGDEGEWGKKDERSRMRGVGWKEWDERGKVKEKKENGKEQHDEGHKAQANVLETGHGEAKA